MTTPRKKSLPLVLIEIMPARMYLAPSDGYTYQVRAKHPYAVTAYVARDYGDPRLPPAWRAAGYRDSRVVVVGWCSTYSKARRLCADIRARRKREPRFMPGIVTYTDRADV
jgi:hypothetical protein